MNDSFTYIDVSYLTEMADDNIEFMNEVISVFKVQVGDLHNDMEQKLHDHDFVALKSVFHKAKSAMSVMGIGEIATKLKNYELADISDYDYYDLKKFIDRFELVCDYAIKELDTFVNEY